MVRDVQTLSARIQDFVGARRTADEKDDRLISCLVVADNAELLRQALATVKVLGRSFEFELAYGLDAGAAMLAQRPFDVVVYDTDPFPVGEARDLEKLQLMAPDTPLLLVVKHGQEQLAQQGMLSGARDYLYKDPLEPELWLRVLAAAAEAAHLERALGNLSRDHVTGLYNRQTFLTLAEQILALAPRSQGVLVLHATLDHSITRLNLIEEHRMILRSAQVFQQTFRKSDILGRWGRHEFVAVLVDAALDTARHLAHRLDVTLQAHNEQHAKLPPVRLHGGLTAVDLQHRLTIAELVAKAQAVGKRSRQRSERRI